MIETVKTWFEALSAREKLLIGVLGGLVAATVIFYGIYKPLSNAIDEAETSYRETIERAARIEDKVAALSGPVDDNPSRQTEPLGDFVSKSAGEAGFAVGRLDPQTDGSVQLTIASAKSVVLFGWLSRLEMRGVAAEKLTVDTTTNGTVTANLTLRNSVQPDQE